MNKVFLKEFLLIFAVLVAFVAVEFLLRLFIPPPENLAKLKSSSNFIYENKPNVVFRYSGAGEFDNEIRINSYGFRDDEFYREKPPDSFRIAVLGDSQEEAMQVALEDTWQKIMAGKLSEALNKKVETYNFGVSGYGMDQEWLTLREKVWQFKPDMVILAFSPNDVGDTYKNRLVEVRNGKLEVISAKERMRGNLLGLWARETYTYHLVVKTASANELTKRLIDRIRVKILGFPKEEKFFLSDAQLVQGPFEVIASQKNPPPEVIEGWEIVKALIFDMKKQADNNQAKFLITINIPRAQVSPSGWNELRDLYKLDPAASSPYEINEVMGKIAKDLGIFFYDPRLDAIDWTNSFGILHFPKDAHFDKNGNLFMGTKVAESILDRGLVSE